MVTSVPGLILGMLTADCGPVLFADKRRASLAAPMRAGRGRSTASPMPPSLKMEELGAQRANIVAVLGPTISKAAYEIGPEFIQRLLRRRTATEFTSQIR